jgi:hypothetical protein
MDIARHMVLAEYWMWESLWWNFGIHRAFFGARISQSVQQTDYKLNGQVSNLSRVKK